MRNSLVFVSAAALGIIAGQLHTTFQFDNKLMVDLFLYLLLAFIGIHIGMDTAKLKESLAISYRDFMVPLLVIIGSLGGALVVSRMLSESHFEIKEILAVGAGFGYYSLSSVLIVDLAGEKLATIALLANLFRELFTLVFSPLLGKVFGRYAPIASAGATSMDTALPVIIKTSGKSIIVTSLLNGFILSILVPFLIPLILSF